MAATQQVSPTLQSSLPVPKFLQSDDGAIISKVEGTHKPDSRQVDVQNLSTIITKILLPHDPSTGGDVTTETSVGREVPAQIIKQLSCELSCNCSSGKAQETTMVLLEKLLSNYSWDAKLMITVAAYAINYGEFHLLTELYNKNSVSKNIALLKQLQGKQLQGIMEDADHLLQQFSGAIIELNKAIVALTQSVLHFNTLPSEYVVNNKPPFSTATTDIARAVYWAIYSVVTSASHIAGLVGLKNQLTIAMMTCELSELVTKVSSIQIILQNHFSRIKKEIESYDMLVNLSNTVQDITTIFQAFFTVEKEGRTETKLSLVKGNNIREKFKIEELKDSKVVLVVSGLDESEVEIKALAKLYEQLQKEQKIQYQLVWIPIVEGQVDEQKFSSLQSLMSWYTVKHPSVVKPEVIRYIKEVWKFSKQAILVSFDQKGRTETVDALNLFLQKGSLPGLLPSSPAKEKSPWEINQLTLDILIQDLYQVDSTEPAPIICLYGGEDMKWIEQFTAAILARMKDFPELKIELIYVSKSNTTDQANKAILDFITTNKIGDYWKAEETKS
ncbi:protein SIEVE ELEMENT OCCLUSION A [Jatropha curcas]|uniref:protein SIEVE ELEMENT OCCLUSION A n=1 Tax=Jatropha curcas TaxID=180498 RepID=UPI001893EE60|nr:protein SIEVE ELEMENT OCCLUSION A [Jatropha curcas]